jgi:glycosyltransferase involved in cell wall biosynthesis
MAPVLFISHEASRTGAPLALRNLLRWFKQNSDLHFQIVLLNDGPLAPDFRALAPTVTLTEVGVGRSRLVRKIGRIPLLGPKLKQVWHRVVTPRVVGQRPSLVYANTVGTARVLRQLVPAGVPVIAHVHEMERAIQIAAGPTGMKTVKSLANRYVASSAAVKQNLVDTHGIDPSLIELLLYFIPIDEAMVRQADHYGREMRTSLGIPNNATVIGGCGGTDWRKGADLFVEMARSIRALLPDRVTHFVWVGKIFDDEFTRAIMDSVRQWGLSDICHFTDVHPKPPELFCGFDLFTLCSREEPMGLVALEAASVGKPIVCFDAGGMPDFVRDDCGKVVSQMTGRALADGVVELLSNPAHFHACGRRAFERVRAIHDVEVLAPRYLKLIRESARLESAVWAGRENSETERSGSIAVEMTQ